MNATGSQYKATVISANLNKTGSVFENKTASRTVVTESVVKNSISLPSGQVS